MGWVIVTVTVIISIAADYWIRSLDGDIHTGGISTFFHWVIIIPCLSIAAKLWFMGTQNFNKVIRFILTGSQVLLSFCTWIFINLLYVCNAGIDCI